MILLSRTTRRPEVPIKLNAFPTIYKRARNNNNNETDRPQVILTIFFSPISKRIAGNTIINNNNIVSRILLCVIIILYRPNLNRTPVVLVARANGGANTGP